MTTTSTAKKKQKAPPEKKRSSHDEIVNAAARLFREKGLAGTGVDEIMRSAGLTHGGFYSHFDDKTALVVEALGKAFADARRYMSIRDELQGEEWLHAVRDRYLSVAHVEAPGAGCVVPAVGAEVSRAVPEIRAAFTQGLEDTLGMLDDKLKCTHLSPEERRQLVLASLMQWVGAMTLARAVDDERLVDEILRTAKRASPTLPR